MRPSSLVLLLTAGWVVAEDTAVLPSAVPAPAAAPESPPAISGRIVIGAGYDSNALLLDESNEIVTNLDGPALSGSLLLRWRILREVDHRLEIGGVADYDYYTDQEQARQFRTGVVATWAKRVGVWLPGASLGAYRYTIDGDGAATVATGSFAWNRPAPTWAALPSIDVLWIDYDDVEIASGVNIAAHYRHWFILRPGRPANRVEVGLKVGTYQAEEDFESYLSIRPGVELRWQDDGDGELAQWTFVGRTWYEYRDYDEAVPLASESETAHRVSIGGEADRRLTPWLTGGGYLALTARRANVDTREYDRFQVGLRLGATF